jgi:glutathione S-transferase
VSKVHVTAFKWVPDFAQGLVRDMRVRWALEEAGIPYTENLLEQGAQNEPSHRAVQPFGQIPVYEKGELTMFESGAIVMHIGEGSPALLPTDPVKRARAITWMFAALNSVEPHVQNLASIDLFFANEEWAKLRRPGAVAMVQAKLDALAASLQGRDYLEREFTAGDLLMTTVLRILRTTSLISAMPVLADYQARCEDRPAFRRALAAQMAPFARNSPAPPR